MPLNKVAALGKTAVAVATERPTPAGPARWERSCRGNAEALAGDRHPSLGDRIRHDGPHRQAQDAIDRPMARLGDREAPAAPAPHSAVVG